MPYHQTNVTRREGTFAARRRDKARMPAILTFNAMRSTLRHPVLADGGTTPEWATSSLPATRSTACRPGVAYNRTSRRQSDVDVEKPPSVHRIPSEANFSRFSVTQASSALTLL
jgi:hypothetical protein